jgi:hypothetical protein
MARTETIGKSKVEYDNKGFVVIEAGTDLGQFSLLQLQDWLEDKRHEANSIGNQAPTPLHTLWQRVAAYTTTKEREERQKQK